MMRRVAWLDYKPHRETKFIRDYQKKMIAAVDRGKYNKGLRVHLDVHNMDSTRSLIAYHEYYHYCSLTIS